MPRLTFEEFAPGTSTYGGVTVSRDDIVAFARLYDPQPFHLDETAARSTFVGTLIASGWHTCALLMRMLADNVLLHAPSMGSPGIEAVRWLKPVLPGDTLGVRETVEETRVSRSRPTVGLVQFRFEVLNQADEVVLEQTNWIMFDRGAGATGIEIATTPPALPKAPVQAAPGFERPRDQGEREPSAFDEVAIGHRADLGAHTFTAEEIVGFARAFDPQPFHVDPEAARRSHFGGLCASGWHTAAIWMRLMIAHRQHAAAAAQARGERPARLGSSPGFRDLRWLKPVYAGDTITYRSVVADKRPSASRPDWGLVFHDNTGVNQHGEEVFRFRGGVFWERRGNV